MCNNLNDALIHRIFFSFKSCEFVVLYIIFLEVARKLSHFCIVTRRSKIFGPRGVSSSNLKTTIITENATTVQPNVLSKLDYL